MYSHSFLISTLAVTLATAVVNVQLGAPVDLRMISQPSTRTQNQRPEGYAYDNIAGGGTTIYMVGGQASEDFTSNSITTRFSRNIPGLMDPTDWGTCQASKASSPFYGVSKLAKIVTVPTQPTIIGVMASLAAVSTLIKDEKAGTAIVHIAHSFESEGAITSREVSFLYTMLKEIIAQGVVVVVPSGKVTSDMARVDSFPALFSIDSDWSTKNNFPKYDHWRKPGLPLIVVAATDNYGAAMSWSRTGPEVNMWAPGKYVKCGSKAAGALARSLPTDQVQSAAVAGMAAYFASTISYTAINRRSTYRDQIPSIVIRDMQYYSFSRKPSDPTHYPQVISNGRTESKFRIDPGWQDD